VPTDTELVRKLWSIENDEICQILGSALGYPRYCDDQKNFPGATEESGVCVGDHVAVTLAMEAARAINRMSLKLEELGLAEELDPSSVRQGSSE
jgi:hypothetical protein